VLQIFHSPAYDFIGKRRWAYGISALLVLAGIVSILAKGGLQYDLDFTGGTLVEMRLPAPMSVGDIRSRLTAAGLGESIIQVFGDPRDVLVRTQAVEADAAQLGRRVAAAISSPASPAEVRRVEFVGPQIGQELRRQALYAVLASLAGILLYIWLRFDFRGGVVTIVSLAHDVVICLGALSLVRFEFSLPVLAALLTVIGFSVNDRIVMYDRLREIRGRKLDRGLTFGDQVNLAVNQTLSRTVLTVATVAMAAAMLFVLGGPTLEGFAFVVLVGALTGTSSTVYVAGALDVDWSAWADRRRGRPALAAARPAGGRNAKSRPR
jgi:preprotein translocase subunit SecF